MKPKWKVKLRCPIADKGGRKQTVTEYVRAEGDVSAVVEALKIHPGWELLKVEEAS